MIKFLKYYSGTKQWWVDKLLKYKDQPFVELFAGSAVLSANLAKTAILNDLDPFIYTLHKKYDQLIVPEVFTREDYYKYRNDKDWWKYLYCLQALSFAGLYRWGDKGYNAAMRKNREKAEVRPEYLEALARWKELKPTVLNLDYFQVPSATFKDSVVVSDPPYEGAQAGYNADPFCFPRYWQYVNDIKPICKTLIVFDWASNLAKQDIPVIMTRNLKATSHHKGDVEAMSISENGIWLNQI